MPGTAAGVLQIETRRAALSSQDGAEGGSLRARGWNLNPARFSFAFIRIHLRFTNLALERIRSLRLAAAMRVTLIAVQSLDGFITKHATPGSDFASLADQVHLRSALAGFDCSVMGAETYLTSFANA
jgi:hypothetical protein